MQMKKMLAKKTGPSGWLCVHYRCKYFIVLYFTPWAKKGDNLFLSVTLWKIKGF